MNSIYLFLILSVAFASFFLVALASLLLFSSVGSAILPMPIPNSPPPLFLPRYIRPVPPRVTQKPPSPL